MRTTPCPARLPRDAGALPAVAGRRRRVLLLGGLCAAGVLLAGCGFHLRGALAIPFETLHVAVPDHSEFGTNLKRAIRAQGRTKLVDKPADAQAILTPTGEVREKSILSLNSAGRVREFQLRYRYNFRVHDQKGQDLMPPAAVILTRDFSFDDAAVLAKEQEEGLLWRDMENDLVHQILRRLANAKPPLPGEAAAPAQ